MTTIPVHPSVELAWQIANTEACLAGSLRIEPVHFLLAALKIADDVIDGAAPNLSATPEAQPSTRQIAAECRQLLGLADAELTAARRALRRQLREQGTPRPVRRLHRTDQARELFESAISRMLERGDRALTLLHLLEQLLDELPSEAAPIFGPRARDLASSPRSSSDAAQAARHESVPPGPVYNAPNRTPTLDRMGRDLTALARAGQLTPVVGRRAEITAMARYLQRTTKRNVLIIGEAGVGKTAIVEGLAQRLADQNAPDFLRCLRVVQINLADLFSGTKYRGDLEKRVQNLMNEATGDENLVLFFDEIHLMMQGGSGSPSEVANLLKPALGGSALRCLGATTLDEYERYLMNDTAFMRRFQVLRLAEPPRDEAVLICREWARRVETIQHVEVDSDAVVAAVDLSSRFIRGRSLPDKAIDLLENAATFIKVSTISFQAPAASPSSLVVTRAAIEEVLREQYGVQVGEHESIDPARVAAELRAALVGQDDAIAEIERALAAQVNRKDSARRPVAILMFAGPSGVGKTFAAEALTEAVFGNPERTLFRCNMNEFKSPHEMARLVGAPPGYVGHEQYGSLFRYVEAQPRGVILLDEMDKAHPEIQDYFLQIFDKGEARDSRGRVADFTQHLFILTCNTRGEGAGERGIGFRAQAEKAKGVAEAPSAELLQIYRRELLGRIDRVVAFRSLAGDDYRQVLAARIAQLARELNQQGVALQVEEAAQVGFCDACVAQKEGVRGFNKLYEQMWLTPLNRYLEAHPEAQTILLDWQDERLSFA